MRIQNCVFVHNEVALDTGFNSWTFVFAETKFTECPEQSTKRLEVTRNTVRVFLTKRILELVDLFNDANVSYLNAIEMNPRRFIDC